MTVVSGQGQVHEATAFPVHHGDALDAFGYRIETPNRTIVLSGDTAPTQSLIDHCAGCDVLIHEAYPLATFGSVSAAWQEFRRTHHTSSKELADIASIVKPGLLVIYHQSNAGNGPAACDSEQILIEEIKRTYKGRVVSGHDSTYSEKLQLRNSDSGIGALTAVVG